MSQFFNVKVQFTDVDEKGKAKKQNINYLVDAMSVTEAEARMTQFLLEEGETNFEIKSASESKIAAVILVDDSGDEKKEEE